MKSKGSRNWTLIGLTLLALAVGSAGGMILSCRILDSPVLSRAESSKQELNFPLITEAVNTIQKVYVDRKAINPHNMTYGAITGIVDSLGDTGHSRFLNPDVAKQETSLIQGRLEGIGAEIRNKNNQITIVAPIDGSPAQKAGLKPGDVILKVNGEEVSTLPLEQVVLRILGPAGTTVRLTILNPSTSETRDVDITRAKITLHNVAWAILPGTRIAHLRVASFSRGVSREVEDALKEIQRHKAAGILLDLRNNPGGLFGEAIRVASQFLSGGNVALVKNAAGKTKNIPVKSGGLAVAVPLVALINEGTASAPEIIVGALQDDQRAKLVGGKTFGTGTVLEKFSLPDGSALLLATEEWLTPLGRVIWHVGILPDVPVALPEGVSALFPEAEKNMTEAELRARGDVQLLRALELFTGEKAGGQKQT